MENKLYESTLAGVTSVSDYLSEAVTIVEKLITFDNKAYPKFGNVVILAGGAGCHAKGTKILKSDFSTINVENISVGDELIGTDGSVRKVLSLHRGNQDFIKLKIPHDGDYFFNKDHIHSFVASYSKNGIIANKVYNMTYSEYKSLTLAKQKALKLYFSEAIERSHNDKLPVHPYLLGYWLGDGTVGVPIILVENKFVEKVMSELSRVIDKNQIINKIKSHHENCTLLSITTGNSRSKNQLRTYLQNISKNSIKRIPFEYFNSSIEQRYELLAGLIDSDGHYHRGSYEIITKFDELKDGIVKLSGSLGLRVKVSVKKAKWKGEVKIYHRIRLSGNFSFLNCRLDHKKWRGSPNKNHLRFAPNFELIGKQDYYGFEVDGDNLYLMSNFLVTHNSGKGFIRSKLLGIEGINFDVDDLKTMAAKTPMIVKRVKDELGVDIEKVAGNLKDPENTSRMHEIINEYLGLNDKKKTALYKSIMLASPERKPNLIFDVTLKDLLKLKNITRQVKNLGYLNNLIHIVWVVNDIEVAKKQNAKRDRTVPVEILINTHRGASQTMLDIVNMGSTLKSYMDGDIVIAFNKVGVDTDLVKSTSGGSYIKDANYFYLKKSGKSVESLSNISKDIRSKISSYVPKNVSWD